MSAHNGAPGESVVSTPQKLVDDIGDRLFGRRFDVDLCATADNAKAPVFVADEPGRDFFSLREKSDQRLRGDALCWMNPPYSRGQINTFVDEAALIHDRCDVTICALVPCAPGTRWYWKAVRRGAKPIGLHPRVAFGGHSRVFKYELSLLVFGPTALVPRAQGARLYDWKTGWFA